MIVLKYVEDINSVPKIKNQLIYNDDSAFFDISDLNRIEIVDKYILINEDSLSSIPDKSKNKLYIVKSNNSVYCYKDNVFKKIEYDIHIIPYIISTTSIFPKVLEKKSTNKKIAPITSASLVFTSDNMSVEEKIQQLKNKTSKNILYTRTEHVMATSNGQRIFTIPFPIPDYDLAIFPMIVVYKDKIISNDNISISNDQIILHEELDGLQRNDILTFIFHYNRIIDEEFGINAESVNNIRYFTGTKEPIDKRDTDVWFDTLNKVVKQYKNGKWEIILSGSRVEDYPFYILKNTTVLNSASEYVEIGIPGFDIKQDTLLVYMNKVYLEENEDYRISSDGNYIITLDHQVWNGDIEDIVFNFVVFKATTSESKKQIMKDTYIIDNNIDTLEIKNFDKNKDSLFVYENSVYLEEGTDYEIVGNSIQKINGIWEGLEDELVINIVVIKTTLSYINEELPDINEVLKNQIFKYIGLTEEDINRIKEIINEE